MSDVSTLGLYLLMLILLLVFCRRMLVATVGAPIVSRIERTLKLFSRGVVWIAMLPAVFAWRLARMHFRRGRPSIAVNASRVADIPVAPRRGRNDVFAFHQRPRRRK
jgi:hypothetical protein